MELRRLALYRVLKNPAAAGLRTPAPNMTPGETVRYLDHQSGMKDEFGELVFSRPGADEIFLRVRYYFDEKFDPAEYFAFESAI